MNLLKKVLSLLTKSEKRSALLLLMLVLIMSIMDMLGVASILPFIAVLTNPQIIETNVLLGYLYDKSGTLGVDSANQFLFFLGIVVFILLLISLSFRALTTYAQYRFTLMREYSIGKRLMQHYLGQPYSWFLNRHSADISKSILSEVTEVIFKTIVPILHIIVHGAITIALLTLLLLVNFKLAITAGLVIGISYILIFQIIKKTLTRMGLMRFKANSNRFTAVSEAFNVIKELKVGRLEDVYLNRFAKHAELYAKSQSIESLISHLPRYLIESICFGGIMILILVMMITGEDFTKIAPIVALYAFAGYRLIPALQQVYVASTQLRFSKEALNSLHEDLSNIQIKKKPLESIVSMPLKKSIDLKNVNFTYPNSKKETLKNINISIPFRSKVGFVGSTGSGKTTLIDFILGLLSSNSGTLSIDNTIITDENKISWQKSLGYVPQDIFLVDEAIRSNIAFGVETKDIDQKMIEKVAKICDLHDFILTDLPLGYDTSIGENGVRLSGGQRQRIGIARAIYKNPSVLILDEATSALDNLTEKKIMKNLLSLNDNLTIIMIAHRLSTIKDCDKIYLLKNGTVKSSGTFSELELSNDLFKKMAQPNN